MKRRIWKTLISALLVTVLLIGVMPVSAASVSTNYNNLVYYINHNGEKNEDGNMSLGVYFTEDEYTMYFFLTNVSSGVEFKVILLGTASERIDMEMSFVLQKYNNTLPVKLYALYAYDNQYVDELDVTKDINRTTFTMESEYTVDGSEYIPSEEASYLFNVTLQSMCMFWDAILQEELYFGIKGLGFNSYCFHQYDNNCDPKCNLCRAVREPPHDYTGWRSCGDDEHQNHCSTCYNYAYEPHNWVGSDPHLPTCQQDGYQWFNCSECGAHRRDVFPKGDEYHTFTPWQQVDEENHSHICELCQSEEVVPHNWSGVLTQKPTEETPGIMTYTCTDCGATKTEEVNFIPGDIDGNGQVNRDDVVALLLHVSMPDAFPITIPADYNGDGQVTRDDVVQLLLHVSMPDAFPLQ